MHANFGDRTLGAPPEEPELAELRVERFSNPLPPRPDHASVSVDPEVHARLAGEYEFEGFRVRLFVHERRLFAHRGDGDEAELLPLAPDRYFLFTTSFVIEFERDGEGVARAARLLTPRGTLTGKRIQGG